MSAQILPAGNWVVGTCRGSRVESVRTEQGPRDRHLLGVEVSSIDSWGVQKSEIVEIRISDAQVRDGVPARAQGLAGCHVAVPVWVQAWTGKRGASHSLIMTNSSTIVELD